MKLSFSLKVDMFVCLITKLLAHLPKNPHFPENMHPVVVSQKCATVNISFCV